MSDVTRAPQPAADPHATPPPIDGLAAGARRLTTLYVIALSAVAALSIAGQFLVQYSLEQQLGDSTVVNIAGRQRMLSQRIAKAALLIQTSGAAAQRSAAMAELHEVLPLWRRSHAGLQHGDAQLGLPGESSAAVTVMFRAIQPAFEKMVAAADELLATRAGEALTDERPSIAPVASILRSEAEFLTGMDRIVFQYDREAQARVARLKLVERVLLALTLAVLLAEGALVFRPAVRRLRIIARRLQATTADLIEAKQAAESASAAKSRFLANISHELRTPLHAILAAAELAQAASPPADERDHLVTIDDAGRLLLGLVNDLLDTAKIEAGKLELDASPTDLATLARRVTALFKSSAAEKGLSLESDVDHRLPLWVVADEQRLKQVLVNLLGNAVKFTDRGRVKLSVEQTAREESQVRVRMSVSDTGIGISQEQQSRVFERFAQVDGSARRKHGGAGLGLAISAYLVELMGGRITLRSEPGRGSTFAFELELPVAAESQPEPAVSDRDAASLEGLSVLVAEDSPVLSRLMQQSLAALGCRVTLAADGYEAVAAYRRHLPDLVLIDVHMPGLDGPHVAAILRNIDIDRGRRPTPIVVLTADALPATRERCLAAGVSELVLKPYRQHELLTAIDKSLGRAPAQPHRERGDALSRLGNRPELLQELSDLFLAEAPRVIAELRSAAERGARAELRKLAHRLKGQIAIFEQGEAYQAARQLEESPASGDASHDRAAIDRLEIAVSEMVDRMRPCCR